MALSSGSSVSEDVPTLIKMCRASGRLCRFSLLHIISFSFAFPLPTSSTASFFLRCNSLRGVCVRQHASGNRLRFLKRTESVTWMAAAGSSKRQVAICSPRMCRHFLPPIDRPITKRPAVTPFGRRTRGCAFDDTR